MRKEVSSSLAGEVYVETRLERVRGGVSRGIEDGVAGLDRVTMTAFLLVP